MNQGHSHRSSLQCIPPSGCSCTIWSQQQGGQGFRAAGEVLLSPQFVAKKRSVFRQYWLAALVDALCIFLRQPDAEIGGREVCRTLVGSLQELNFFQDLKFLPNPNPCEMLRWIIMNKWLFWIYTCCRLQPCGVDWLPGPWVIFNQIGKLWKF